MLQFAYLAKNWLNLPYREAGTGNWLRRTTGQPKTSQQPMRSVAWRSYVQGEIKLDHVSKEKRSEIMRNIRNKNTGPELLVRSMIHRMGYRFRLHAKYLPGKPDLVFPSRKKVIFVHGCFWHLHEGCSDAAFPKSNKQFWIPKLLLNRQRDWNILHELKKLGWKVLVIWQCQISNTSVLSKRIKRFLG